MTKLNFCFMCYKYYIKLQIIAIFRIFSEIRKIFANKGVQKMMSQIT